MRAAPGGYLAVDNVSRLIQEVKNILDKKDVLHQANGTNRITNRFGNSQVEFSHNTQQFREKIYNEGTDGSAKELSTNLLHVAGQTHHKDSQARMSGFGSSGNIQSRPEALETSNHFRIASAAGHRFDIHANPAVSFEHETSLRTANSGYWPKAPRKIASSGGIQFRFSGRLALMASFIEQYDRVQTSLPNPVANMLKGLSSLQVKKVAATLSASSKLALQKLQAGSARVVDYSQSSARSLGKTSSRRTPKGYSTTTTPKQPQVVNKSPPIFSFPPGQGPKNMTKQNHILDCDTADVPSVRDLPVCEQPINTSISVLNIGQNLGKKGAVYTPQPVNSRPEVVDGRPNNRCRRALAALAVYSPAECARSNPSQTSSSLPRVGKTFSLRPNRPVKPSTPKAPHKGEEEQVRAEPDSDGWTVFRELTVERSVQLMQAFLLAEMKQRALVSESVQTENPAMMESVPVPETAQCNFVPVFPVEIQKPAQSLRNPDEDDEQERTLNVYAERDWRLQSTNKEGLYEALRDQLERTSERMSLERAKESMKQAKAAQMRAEQEQRQKLAKQQLLRDSGTSVDFISEHSEQYCRHLDCLTSGLSEEHYVHIADARQSRKDPPVTTPTKPKVLVNLYGSRLLEDTLSGARMLSPSQESHGSTYVRIGDILPHNHHNNGSQRVSASTKIAISTLSSSRDSRMGSNPRFARVDPRFASVRETDTPEADIYPTPG